MYLWDTNRLAIALANNELSPEDKFKYLLVNNVMYGGSGYLATLFFVTGSGGWLYWYEAFMVVVVTYLGLIRCKARYAPTNNDRLLENCVMLGLPLGMKLMLFTWAAHYSSHVAVEWAVAHLSFQSENDTGLITFALNATITFHAFLIAVLGIAWYYWRLGVHLETSAACPLTLRSSGTR